MGCQHFCRFRKTSYFAGRKSSYCSKECDLKQMLILKCCRKAAWIVDLINQAFPVALQRLLNKHQKKYSGIVDISPI